MLKYKIPEHRITPEDEVFIKKTHLLLSISEVAKLIGKTKGKVAYSKRKLKLTNSKAQSLFMLNKNRKKILTKENELFIRENYLKMSSQDLANLIGCKRSPVLTFKYKNNLIVPKELSLKFIIDKKHSDAKV